MHRLFFIALLTGILVTGCGGAVDSAGQTTTSPEQTADVPKTVLTEEEEKQTLEEVFNKVSSIYSIVSDHYESQLESYDPAQWTEIQHTYSKELNELRHKLRDIKTSESKFSKAYSVLDIMIIKLDLDIIPEMQKKLDGTGGDPTQFRSEFEAVKEEFNLD
jgi:hypothetical protein